MSRLARLVELHAGTIEAASPGRGKGATFTVRLPVLRVADSTSPLGDRGSADHGSRPLPGNAADVVPPSVLDGTSILVVEDDADSRAYLVLVLERAGASVTAVASAAAGFDELLGKPVDPVSLVAASARLIARIG